MQSMIESLKFVLAEKTKLFISLKNVCQKNDLSRQIEKVVGSKDVPQHKSSTYVDRNLMSCLEKLKLKLCFKEWCRTINSFCMLRFV